ncbi:hypothetical protein [Pseudoruegeria sp. HB172150]|uniref:hypothetical protein n=1 Tax=Pseudoruegeria sp. HB172150 TaxID=2721164 RepID=UPI001556600F|nr:hypothetical protein [Pseudoruegeria sp. HB172150]
MEILLAILLFTLAACGLAAGLMLGGRPPETSCSGISCIKGAKCETCPRRLAAEAEAEAENA